MELQPRNHHASLQRILAKYLWKTRSVSPRPFSTASAVDQQLGITPSVTSIDEESQAELDEKASSDALNPT